MTVSIELLQARVNALEAENASLVTTITLAKDSALELLYALDKKQEGYRPRSEAEVSSLIRGLIIELSD